MLAELERIRAEPVTDDELAAARDYLVGVFPIRFETPGAVLGALAGLAVHDLPDDELTRYRERIEAVTSDDVLAAAREHIDLDRLAIVIVGDADTIASELGRRGPGRIDVERDERRRPRAATRRSRSRSGRSTPSRRSRSPSDDDPMRDPAEEPDDGRPA